MCGFLRKCLSTSLLTSSEHVSSNLPKVTEGRWSGRQSLTGRLLRAGNVGSDLGLRGSQPHTPSIAPGTTSSEETAAECRGWLRNVLLRHCCPPQPCTRDRDSWGGDLNSTSLSEIFPHSPSILGKYTLRRSPRETRTDAQLRPHEEESPRPLVTFS